MKICHVFGYGPDKLGALEKYILAVQEYCNEHEVEALFVFTREPITEFKLLFDQLNGVCQVIPHDKSLLSLAFMFRLLELFMKYRPTIVHSHFDSVTLQSTLIARLVGVPRIYWHQRNILGDKLFYLRNLVYRFISRYTTSILAVSEAVKVDLNRRGVNKVLVITNGLGARASNNRVEESSFLKDQSITAGKKIVLSVAQARPEKDLETLIRAIPLVKDYQEFCFVIVGGGPLIPDLKALAQRMQIQNIRFIGKRNDIDAIMQISFLFVLTSKREGLPNVVGEAMLNRLPVIATRVGGIPELVLDGVTGMTFDSGDFYKLADLIDQLRDPNERLRLTDNAYLHIMSNFNLQKKVAETFETIYLM